MFFGLKSQSKQQGFVALFSFRVVNRRSVFSSRPVVLRKKNKKKHLPDDQSPYPLMCRLNTHISTRLLCSTSVELVVDAEVWPGDIVGVEEDGNRFPRVLGDQLLQPLGQLVL